MLDLYPQVTFEKFKDYKGSSPPKSKKILLRYNSDHRVSPFAHPIYAGVYCNKDICPILSDNAATYLHCL
ncbi:MAG: hypothetical protein IPG00_12295 [Saprospiraceae bacterium]|nr:hypothetical protein [Saprospiraceae bacterium]